MRQSSYPAEVRKWNFSPFFSAKGVVKFGVKFWWNFPHYVFQGLGVRRKISPIFHVKNGVKNGTFHANFTLLGRSADDAGSILKFRIGFSPWFSAVASQLRLSLLLGFGETEAINTELPYRAPIVDRGGDCRTPVCRPHFRFLDSHVDDIKELRPGSYPDFKRGFWPDCMNLG